MPIYYVKEKSCYRFAFNRIINGHRYRATQLLPKNWSEAQCAEFERKETARIYAEASGIQERKWYVNEAIQCYVENKLKELKDKKNIGQELAKLLPYTNGKELNELQEVAKQYTQEHEKRLKPATIRNRLAYLRSAIKYAYKFFGIGERDCSGRIIMPKVSNERHLYLSRRESIQLARSCRHRPTRALILIAFYTGMRWQSEILAIDPKTNIVDDLFYLGTTKNGKPHVVPIHPKIAIYLKYFPFRLHARTYYKKFEETRKRAGLPEVWMHTLRHSFASELLKSGANLKQIGEMLNHKSQASTNRYAHLAVEEKRKLIRMVGK